MTLTRLSEGEREREERERRESCFVSKKNKSFFSFSFVSLSKPEKKIDEKKRTLFF